MKIIESEVVLNVLLMGKVCGLGHLAQVYFCLREAVIYTFYIKPSTVVNEAKGKYPTCTRFPLSTLCRGREPRQASFSP